MSSFEAAEAVVITLYERAGGAAQAYYVDSSSRSEQDGRALHAVARELFRATQTGAVEHPNFFHRIAIAEREIRFLEALMELGSKEYSAQAVKFLPWRLLSTR